MLWAEVRGVAVEGDYRWPGVGEVFRTDTFKLGESDG